MGIFDFVGDIFSPSTDTVTTETDPWYPQQPYLQELFRRAGNTNSEVMDEGLGFYDGPFSAQMGDQMKRDLSGLRGLSRRGSNVFGQGFAGNFGRANDAMRRFGNASDNNMNYALRDPTKFTERQAKGYVNNARFQNQAGRTVRDADQFVNNDLLQEQIDAALEDVDRNFGRSRASLNANAGATGNINSTRAGVSEALLEDEAKDRAASVAAGMRGSAYDRGLQLSASQDQNRIDGYMQSLGLAGSQYQDRFNNRMNAAGQLGQAGSALGTFADQGYSRAMDSLGSAVGAGERFVDDRARRIAGNMQGAEYDANRRYDMLDRYGRLVTGNFGGTTENPVQGQSPFGQITGGILSGIGLFGG